MGFWVFTFTFVLRFNLVWANLGCAGDLRSEAWLSFEGLRIEGVKVYYKRAYVAHLGSYRPANDARSLLILLVERPGKLVSDDEIFETLWPNLPVAQAKMAKAQTLAYLRRAFRFVAPDFNLIRTVPGCGVIYDREWNSGACPAEVERKNLTLEIATAEFIYRNQYVRLTPSGYLLLLALVREPGRYVSRRALLVVLGSPGDDDDGAVSPRDNDLLKVQIHTLRSRFREINPRFNQIKNRKKVGYAWLGTFSLLKPTPPPPITHVDLNTAEEDRAY